ncbi:MAG TPA: SDR family oxidoreductase [Gemmatimonadaceae bacterium]|nr:SDR family oxidoreductase [Gemmatimonadaceae bacterium]
MTTRTAPGKAGRNVRGGARTNGQKREAEQRRERSRPKAPMPKQHQEHPGLEARMKPRPQYKAPLYKGSGKLTGKVALITGGDSGIGRAVAVLFAREGANVAIMFLPEEEVDAVETRRAIEAEGRRALLLPGDVTDPEYCKECVDSVVNELGVLDILVNNAAFQENKGSIDEISLEQFDKTFKTNIYGYFYLTRFALPRMKRGASIINTGSITGLEGHKELLDYAATKGAIHAFTKSLAQNLVEKGIRVNCVAPGPVWTPLNMAASESAEDVAEFGGDTPMKRAGQPEEIAPTYVFLASNVDSSYITGEVITLLGGETTAA